MSTSQSPCPDCGRNANLTVGQTMLEAGVAWHRAWSCPHCGLQIEEDGWETPEPIRQALFDAEGRWTLQLEGDSPAAESLKVIRDVLDLSMDDIKRIRDDPSRPLYTGTRTEVAWLHGRLTAAGLQAISQKGDITD